MRHYETQALIKQHNLFNFDLDYQIFDPAIAGLLNDNYTMSGDEIIDKLDSIMDKLGHYYKAPTATVDGKLLASNGMVIAVKIIKDNLPNNHITDIYKEGITIQDKKGYTVNAKIINDEFILERVKL